MDRKTLITRAVILLFALLALVEGWSLATAPRPAPNAGHGPFENATGAP